MAKTEILLYDCVTTWLKSQPRRFDGYKLYTKSGGCRSDLVNLKTQETIICFVFSEPYAEFDGAIHLWDYDNKLHMLDTLDTVIQFCGDSIVLDKINSTAIVPERIDLHASNPKFFNKLQIYIQRFIRQKGYKHGWH